MNGTSKLTYYIILDWKGLPGTNTLAYWGCPFMSHKENEVL